MPESKLVEIDEFSVMGIEVSTSPAREADRRTARLPQLWGVFFSQDIAGKIPHAKDRNEHLGLYSDYDQDPKSPNFGSYAAIAGCEVTEVEEVPEGMVAMTVPAGHYLLFEAKGPMPETLIQTWEEITRFFEATSQYVRAYTVDFDLYRKDEPETVEIFVSVK